MTAPRPDETDIYLPRPATLIETESLTAHERFFRFEMDAGVELSYRPGQFLEISMPGFGECPISISSAPSAGGDRGFELVVRRVGNVTRALHGLEPGDRIGVRGPFGAPFPVEDALTGHDLLFICGGLGLVPLRSAINYVLNRRDDYGEVTVLLGARTPADRLFTRELYAWKLRDDLVLEETVDAADPSWGAHVGVITKLIPRLKLAPENTRALICGPPIMYRFVLKELEKQGMSAEHIYLSLERRMKCGVGKCGHCQINGLYTCRQGPVFKYADIAAVREAI
ncbi:MAG TPA: oxidoreductase [Sedimenticola sp.]|nr:oxidoreductase [Sedimenticola sp.]